MFVRPVGLDAVAGFAQCDCGMAVLGDCLLQCPELHGRIGLPAIRIGIIVFRHGGR